MPKKENEEIRFKKQVGGVFDGMPLFDGKPDHLPAFVDAYFNYTGLEGAAVYATGTRNPYSLQRGKNAGKVIPGALSAADDVQGISTDFPALVGMGQTWNKELLADIGHVMGSEKISTLKVKQGQSNIHGGPDSSLTVAFTAETDLRINPLSGRFDEGYAEDAYLVSTMVEHMAAGIGGTNLPENKDGFWLRAVVGTKHYSFYNAQWYRFSTNTSTGARSIFEYHTRSPLLALSTGSVSGVMTSFGRNNGIPNILSPIHLYANNHSKYGVYSSPDFNADGHVYGENRQGNGYDTKYAVDRTHATLLMVLAKANAGRPGPSSENGIADVLALVEAVEKGIYGVTKEDLIAAARPHVNHMVRVGIFNEVDENRIPKYYPFASYAKDVAEKPSTFLEDRHQEIALQAAKESIVLLKNDGVLPLNKQQKAAISGMYADARFKPTASVRVTPEIEHSGITPLLAIMKKIGNDHIFYSPGVPIIALTSTATGETVCADKTALEGSILRTTQKPVHVDHLEQCFELYDWGQEGYSLRSRINGRWVTSPDSGNKAIANTDQTQLTMTKNDWSQVLMQGYTSSIPPRLRIEQNEDETVTIITNGFRTGFTGEFSNWYYANGRFIERSEDGRLISSSQPLENETQAAKRGDHVKFKQTVIQKVGHDMIERALIDDYALLFVGAIPRHSAGEGNDRSSLYIGKVDYELVDKVSAAFAAQGKKTVVVVKSSFPVGMEEIQNNPNVSAIIYQPYAGQYDSYALAEILFGDDVPTGRLTSSWYANMTALPSISKYAIPEGNHLDQLGVSIDPRYTVDMTNADPIEAKLTYMYTDAPVTYEFGFGLSYTSFHYSHFTVPSKVSDTPFVVMVNVTNSGLVSSSEVVQLYIKNNQSEYGIYAPKKQLIAFEKVRIESGETKTVNLTVHPKDFAIWDVNLSDFIVEKGKYTLMIGASSEDIREEQTIDVEGRPISTLYSNSFNVFDHSYAAYETVYHEVSKSRTAANLKEKKVVGGYHAVRSKQSGAWVVIPKVNLTQVTMVTARVASDGHGGQISLHVGSLEHEAIAVIHVPATGPVSYMLENTEVEVKELGYVDVTTAITSSLAGHYDLYVVFNEADLRIDRLTWS